MARKTKAELKAQVQELQDLVTRLGSALSEKIEGHTHADSCMLVDKGTDYCSCGLGDDQDLLAEAEEAGNERAS